jgi:preprotein translocase subunit SecD
MEDQKKKNNRSSKIIFGIVGLSGLVCGLLVLGIVYRFGSQYFEPKTQIVLEPDYSVVSTVNPSDLETDAQILTARCHNLGIRASFVVSENNQIIAQVPKSIDVQVFARITTAIWLSEIVDFGETPIPPGTTIATDFSYKYFPPVEGTKWHTVITNSDFESAYVQLDASGKYQVAFTLTSDGTRKFADYTTKSVGHYLGIVIDKVVVSAPKVNSPITDGRGVIAGTFTQEVAEYLAVQLHTKGPLPIPLKIK